MSEHEAGWQRDPITAGGSPQGGMVRRDNQPWGQLISATMLLQFKWSGALSVN